MARSTRTYLFRSIKRAQESRGSDELRQRTAARERPFRHLGGRTAEFLYVRMRTVTTGATSAEGKARWNATFEAANRRKGRIG